MRSLRNRFLRCIYLVADTRLKQIMFKFALVSCFSFCMFQTFTALSSPHVINSITKFPSNALNMQGKYSQPAKLCNTLYHCIFYFSKIWSVPKVRHSKWPWLLHLTYSKEKFDFKINILWSVSKVSHHKKHF